VDVCRALSAVGELYANTVLSMCLFAVCLFVVCVLT